MSTDQGVDHPKREQIQWGVVAIAVAVLVVVLGTLLFMFYQQTGVTPTSSPTASATPTATPTPKGNIRPDFLLGAVLLISTLLIVGTMTLSRLLTANDAARRFAELEATVKDANKSLDNVSKQLRDLTTALREDIARRKGADD